MSKERLQDLAQALKANGWQILTEDSYAVEDELITWQLRNTKSDELLRLHFHIYGDLGQRSDSLADILYCVSDKSSVKMYFEKRGSEKWLDSLAGFVSELSLTKKTLD